MELLQYITVYVKHFMSLRHKVIIVLIVIVHVMRVLTEQYLSGIPRKINFNPFKVSGRSSTMKLSTLMMKLAPPSRLLNLIGLVSTSYLLQNEFFRISAATNVTRHQSMLLSKCQVTLCGIEKMTQNKKFISWTKTTGQLYYFYSCKVRQKITCRNQLDKCDYSCCNTV